MLHLHSFVAIIHSIHLHYRAAASPGEAEGARHSQATKSSSSGASDTSDYMESLSVSSFSSCDACDRHAARPRSGKEYATIDRSALAGPAV